MKDIEFITDRQIYERVIQEAVPTAKTFLWLATADLKDLHVHRGKKMVPFLTVAPEMISAIMEQFDHLWMGASCEACDRRQYCADPPGL
ncbi:MAG: hypothetical protein HN341_02195 [Verrucomicrobia bacterium]|jgi:hypothetical protein|nr:hypothetical protein [Verrucomicrobiota bacterium]